MREFISTLKVKDINLLYSINSGIKCGFLDIVMPYITQLGSAGFTIALPLAMILYNKNDLRILGIEILAALSTSHLVVEVVKRAVNRPRPCIVFKDINSFNIRLLNYSFPSGHTTAAFSVAVVLSLNIMTFIPVFIFLAFVVGISRIYLGVHYPSDVLIGSIIGSSFAVITHMLF